MRRLSASLVVLALALLVMVGATPEAQAHAYVLGSNPADGSTVSRSPTELRVRFSEHVVLAATTMHLVDGDGRSYPVTGLHLVAKDAEDLEQPAEIVGRVPRLPTNSYRVVWQTLSSDDLHRTQGMFVFGVGEAVTATPLSEAPPRPEEALLRWSLLVGLSLGLGGALAGRVLARVPGPEARGAARLTSAASFVGAAGAAVVAVALLVVQVAPGGTSLTDVASSGYGWRWSVRESGLVLLALSALALRRNVLRRSRRGILVAGAAAAGVGTALLGHAGAGGRLDPVRVTATAGHLVAALTWAGAVVCLAAAVLPQVLPRALPVVPTRAALRGFACPAAWCVSVMAVTGVYLASHVVVSVDAVLVTSYGRTLLVKVGLVGLAGALALANHRRLRGRRDLAVPRRTVAAEALVALAVVAATALLTSSQPATEPQLVRSTVHATQGQRASSCRTSRRRSG